MYQHIGVALLKNNANFCNGGVVIIPVILSGGSGTRLWPLSRALKPKQLLPLVNESTMIQDTITRLTGIKNLSAPVIVCNEEHRFMIAEQMREIGIRPSAIILEPVGRNTAPAVAVSAEFAAGLDNDAVLLVLPADHVIQNTQAFHAAIATGYEAAKQNKLVTFGIVPNVPETGYGYIQFLEGKPGLKKVKTFTEKPALALAKTFLESGDFVWNSGVFVWGVKAILKSFQTYLPELSEAFEEIRPKLRTPDEPAQVARIYAQTKSVSIDYGVMEKAAGI